MSVDLQAPLPQPTITAEAPPTRGQETARLIGIDLARALAVFGMYAVHVGPPSPAVPGFGGWLIGLAEGRASALFALLAGFLLVLLAGRTAPKTGRAMRQAKGRIILRSAVLLVTGTALTILVGDVVILNYYAIYFLLAIPLLRLSASRLAMLAGVLAVLTPLLQLAATQVASQGLQEAIAGVDPLARICGVGLLDLLFTGSYPAITWMTFVVAGMALGRVDLASTAMRLRAAAVGAGLTLIGYGIPWSIAQVIGGTFKSLHDAPSGRAAEAFASSATQAAPVEGETWMTYLLAQPHTGSTFDLLGCIGIAVLIVIGCVVAMERMTRLRRVLTPVIAVGTMSLTAYVAHFLVPQLLGLPAGSETSVIPLLIFIAVAIIFAGTWSRFARRGPLEQLLHLATQPAAQIR